MGKHSFFTKHGFYLGVFFFVFVLIIRPFAISQGPESDSLKDLFLKEAPEQWQQYGEFLNTLQGSSTQKWWTNGKLDSHSISSFKQNKTSKLCEKLFLPIPDTKKKPQANGYVFAINPHYEFTLNRLSQETPWVLTNLGKDPKKSTTGVASKFTPTNILRGLIKIRTTELPNLVKEPTFTVLSAKKISYDGTDAVQIDFDNPHPVGKDSKGNGYFSLWSGTLILDPAASWCLRAGNALCKDPDRNVTVKIKTSFRDPKAKYPIPLKISEKWDNFYPEDKRTILLESETDFDLETPTHLPGDNEFRLTAFGMPEIVDAPWAQPVRWYLWLGIGGLLCLLAGLSLQWFKKRSLSNPN